jgi:ABC-type proline/glycine betaine transport system permease subunit
MMQQQVEEVGASGVAAVASKITYGGIGTVTAGWLTTNNVLTIAGFIVGVLGFLVNAYYKRQHAELERRQDARLQEEHEATMRRLEQAP